MEERRGSEKEMRDWRNRKRRGRRETKQEEKERGIKKYIKTFTFTSKFV